EQLGPSPLEADKRLKAIKKKLAQIAKLKERGGELDAEAKEKVASEAELLREVGCLERGVPFEPPARPPPPNIATVLEHMVKKTSLFPPLSDAFKKRLHGELQPKGEETANTFGYAHNRLQRIVHSMVKALQMDPGTSVERWNADVWKKAKSWVEKRQQEAGVDIDDCLRILLDAWYDEAKAAWEATQNGTHRLDNVVRYSQSSGSGAAAPEVVPPAQTPIPKPRPDDWRSMFAGSLSKSSAFAVLEQWFGIDGVVARITNVNPDFVREYRQMQEDIVKCHGAKAQLECWLQKADLDNPKAGTRNQLFEAVEDSKRKCVASHKVVLEHLDKASTIRQETLAMVQDERRSQELRKALADANVVSNEMLHSLTLRIKGSMVVLLFYWRIFKRIECYMMLLRFFAPGQSAMHVKIEQQWSKANHAIAGHCLGQREGVLAEDNKGDPEVLVAVIRAGVADCETLLSGCATTGQPWDVRHAVDQAEHIWDDYEAVQEYCNIGPPKTLYDNWGKHELIRNEFVEKNEHMVKGVNAVDFQICVNEPRCKLCAEIAFPRQVDPKVVFQALEARAQRKCADAFSPQHGTPHPPNHHHFPPSPPPPPPRPRRLSVAP
ncbi:unnamed protein product, partial [Prorocentrum cordatum]